MSRTSISLRTEPANPTASLGTAPKQYVDATVRTGLAPVTLTPGTTVATDASLGSRFRLTPAQNFTLSNPTNPTDGQMCLWEIIQPASGGPYTITLGSAFALGTDITAVTLTTTASKRDFMGAIYNSTAAKWFVIAFVKGY